MRTLRRGLFLLVLGLGLASSADADAQKNQRPPKQDVLAKRRAMRPGKRQPSARPEPARQRLTKAAPVVRPLEDILNDVDAWGIVRVPSGERAVVTADSPEHEARIREHLRGQPGVRVRTSYGPGGETKTEYFEIQETTRSGSMRTVTVDVNTAAQAYPAQR